MSPRKPKQEVITFKVDATVAEAMRGIPNRSEFIRSAILAAFENTCPLCKGMGILSPDQLGHWRAFSENHQVLECDDCHAFHLVCAAQTESAKRAAAGAHHTPPEPAGSAPPVGHRARGGGARAKRAKAGPE
jgi:hypothetical protein